VLAPPLKIVLFNTEFYTPLQRRILHLNRKRFTLWRAGRRSGKTTGARRWLLTESLSPVRVEIPSFWVSPIIETARKVFAHFCREYRKAIYDFNLTRREVILLNGRSIFFVGADNPGSIEGEGAWAVVLDEARHLRNNMVWEETLRPMLSDCAEIGGGRSLIISTPGYDGHWFSNYCDWTNSEDEALKKRFEDYTQFTTKTLEAGTIPESEIEAAKASMPEDVFLRNYEALETPPGEAIYKEFGKHNLIQELPKWFSRSMVNVGVDFGATDDHPTVFIVMASDYARRFHFIVEETYLYKANQLEVLAEATRISSRHYPENFFCDHNRPDFVREMVKVGIKARLAKKDVLDGIEKVRTLLLKKPDSGIPNLYFIEKKTRKLQAEAQSYCYKPGTQIPVKDNDHGLDGLRYVIMGVVHNRATTVRDNG